MQRAVSSNKSSSCLVTCRFKQLSDTLAASNGSMEPSTTTSVSNLEVEGASNANDPLWRRRYRFSLHGFETRSLQSLCRSRIAPESCAVLQWAGTTEVRSTKVESGLSFEVIWSDQDVIEVVFSCSNGTFSGRAEIYLSH